jgi:aminopeptidase N
LKNQIKTAETPELVDQLFAEYVKSTDANYKREIGVALSASNNDATIDRVMASYKDAEIIKPQDLRFWWFSLVRRDATQEKAWNWLVENWTWLEEKLGGDMSFFQFIVTLGQTLKTPEMKAKFDAFFGPKLSDVALKRNIIMAQNGIDANIALVDSQKDKTVSAVVDMVK